MTATLRVNLEIGKKRRVVVGALDWPGLDRWGTSEDDTLDKLLSNVPRYVGVAERAGTGSAFARARVMDSILDGTHDLGYSDRAHLTRDLRVLTGFTPAQTRHRDEPI